MMKLCVPLIPFNMNIARKLANVLHYLEIQDDTLYEAILESDEELASWWAIQSLEDELARKKAEKEITDILENDTE